MRTTPRLVMLHGMAVLFGVAIGPVACGGGGRGGAGGVDSQSDASVSTVDAGGSERDAAKGPCANSGDCATGTVCDALTGRCVACNSDADCKTGEACVDNICEASCKNSLDCPSGRVCDPSSKLCVECATTADCPATRQCVGNACRLPCASDRTCTPDGLLCDRTLGVCVQCLADTECPAGRFCQTGTCKNQVCTPGRAVCVDGGVAVCNASGSGFGAVSPCAALSCVNKAAGAECTENDGGSPSAFPVDESGNEVGVTPWAPSSACVDRVAKLLPTLTLTQKIGQMMQPHHGATLPSDVPALFLGSVLSGADIDPPGGNSIDNWASLVSSYLNAASTMAPKLPLLYGVDAVHGNNNVQDAVIFPHNIGLGATRNPLLVRQVGRITALETLGVGVNWTFAPVVAAARDERWGRTYESFGETPGLAAQMGAAMVLGLQNGKLGAPQSILASAKHFAGDGATQNGVNEGNVVMDEDTFRALAIRQYKPAVDLGVGSIMASFSSFNGTKLHANKHLLTEVLKGELGFKGFVVSDWAGIEKIPNMTYSDQVATSINAGLDMIMAPASTFASTLSNLVQAGTVPLSRIDDAAGRILTVKCEMGLFDQPTTVDPALKAAIGSPEHRAVAREAVRQSLVLLKNEGSVLPLSKTIPRLVVAGSGADSLAKQCGGWTINWGGLDSRYPPSTTTGTTVCKAIQDVLGAGNVVFSASGDPSVINGSGASVGVAVIGEAPYAESAGDRTDLSLAAADIATVKSLHDAGLKVVVVLFSGRPMILDSILGLSDAIVAAWLPGSEGAGIADVLFGDAQPTGKLGFSWPQSMAQIPINLGDATYSPLYPFGYGLSYGSSSSSSSSGTSSSSSSSSSKSSTASSSSSSSSSSQSSTASSSLSSSSSSRSSTASSSSSSSSASKSSTASFSSSSSSSSSASSSSSSALQPPAGCINPILVATGSIGNFNITSVNAVCFATSDDISGWGCSSIDDRTVEVNGQPTTCAALPLPAKTSDGRYYFALSAGRTYYGSLFWW